MAVIKKEWRRSIFYRPLRQLNYVMWQKYKKEILADTRKTRHTTAELTQAVNQRRREHLNFIDAAERILADRPRFQTRALLELELRQRLPPQIMVEFEPAFRAYTQTCDPNMSNTQAEEARKRADWLMRKAQKKTGFRFDHSKL